MEPKQPINATLADSGKDGVEVEPESPSQLPSLTSGVRKPAFTPPQVDELRHQSLVLKYLVAGLPVPFHLILPIWKSVAKSFGSDNGGIYNHYPSFIGFSRFDYCQMMDPEPGRCRRTDGKKWRCSKDVVPDQKYCERHMHRGRQRSRNLVVASGIASELNKSPNSYNTITVTNPSVHTDMKSNPSTSNPVNLELATPSSNACNDNVVLEKNLMIVTTVHQTRHIGTTESKKHLSCKKDSARTTIGSLPSSGGNNVSSRNNNKHIDDNQSGNTESGQIFSCFGDGAKSTVGGLPINGANHGSGSNSNGGDGNCSGNGQINSRINFKESSRNDDEHGSFVGHVTGFYTKSFLKGCDSSPYIDYWNAPEANMQRCRRTDGKKWRCSRDVVPDQKYCGRHIHRGAKKLMIGAEVNSELVTVAAAAPASHLHIAPPLGIPKKVGGYTNLDTDLSMSITASPEPMDGGDQSRSPGGDSSSSDATTITDENGSISHLLAVSP